ncbi:hypothetical protein HAP48_0034550 [Bradyrhizobium septentrionale]|uniref:Uncharacterized protein n=1 Tax=Bradyrhizobium septentrionale TaxID=1404411 RepID=A0A974A1Q6_9BRAD|nr:hypothetical protein [Bradyrhizobium septentrionale]UGY13658.1 hypothetical protein HAP48_0034550 [Bradyrhizobium septentrionale]UGY22295.1 hypothetical protein HU675_0030485 [Bradyrhizobium septentrionale]
MIDLCRLAHLFALMAQAPRALSRPGRSAACNDALLNRDPQVHSTKTMGPASTVHRCAMHRARDKRGRHD